MKSPSPASSSAAARDPGRFKVGTLSYTKAGLVTVFLFLLWGDFCFTLMETVVPAILPLKLNSIGAPNWALGLIVVTIPNIMGASINPWISFRSDRFRSKWGRRIPFLIGATPFVVIFLGLLGYAEPIGRWLFALLPVGSASETTVLLLVTGGLMICFQFFNLFITSIYYYLFNDVVPQAFLARFMALFRVVGTAAGSGFNFFILKYAESHTQYIFLGAGLLYLVAFVMMCLKVREGNYPPPPPYVGKHTGVLGAIRTYASECFTHRFYWYIFLANSCVALTWASGSYQLLFQTRYLGLELDFVGKVNSVCGIITLVLLYPAGIIADRAHPLRVLRFATGLNAVTSLLFFGFALTSPLLAASQVTWLFIVMSAVTLPFLTLYYAAELPTLMKLLPKDRYGQFCSANALVRSGMLILGGVGCGVFFDLVAKLHPNSDYSFRFHPALNSVFYAGSAFFLFLVHREWKRLGGKEAFVPPLSTPPTAPAAEAPAAAVASAGR